jgi:SAM-dependent methyltransferase
MWVEQWSEKHERPFYVNLVTKQTEWAIPGGLSIAESYDLVTTRAAEESACAKKQAVVPPDNELAERALSEVRTFHNQIKRYLIGLAIGERQHVRVLDVASGKGGDLLKYTKHPAVRVLHGFDVSEKCVEEANRRAGVQEQLHKTQCQIKYWKHDGRKRQRWGDSNTVYDVISAQFCVHYWFSGLPLALRFFQQCRRITASENTVLIMTYVNETELAAQLFGTQVPYFIPLPEDVCTVLTCVESRTPQPYPYIFDLDKCVHRLAEYSIPYSVLEQVASQAGWKIVLNEPFHEFGRKHCMLVPSLEEGFAISKMYNVCMLKPI